MYTSIHIPICTHTYTTGMRLWIHMFLHKSRYMMIYVQTESQMQMHIPMCTRVHMHVYVLYTDACVGVCLYVNAYMVPTYVCTCVCINKYILLFELYELLYAYVYDCICSHVCPVAARLPSSIPIPFHRGTGAPKLWHRGEVVLLIILIGLAIHHPSGSSEFDAICRGPLNTTSSWDSFGDLHVSMCELRRRRIFKVCEFVFWKTFDLHHQHALGAENPWENSNGTVALVPPCRWTFAQKRPLMSSEDRWKEGGVIHF